MWALARNALFRLDAETTHELAMRALRLVPSARTAYECGPVESMGIHFPNPVGLAAGFDKNAHAIGQLASLGFGCIEVGTLTWHAQEGNPRPRLFRIPKDRAIMNRMGFNNDGVEVVSQRIEECRNRGQVLVPLGINIGKSKVTPNEDAADEYARSFSRVADLADYVVLNVSSPNTPGLRDLQAEDALAELLGRVALENSKRQSPVPLVLKIAPDLDDEGALACARLADEHAFSGLIISNTTIQRDGLIGPVPEGSGGISGRPLFSRSTALLRIVAESYKGRLSLIGVGGIENIATAQEKLDAGADLIQVYTGFIYGGPAFPRRLATGLSSGEE